MQQQSNIVTVYHLCIDYQHRGGSFGSHTVGVYDSKALVVAAFKEASCDIISRMQTRRAEPMKLSAELAAELKLYKGEGEERVLLETQPDDVFIQYDGSVLYIEDLWLGDEFTTLSALSELTVSWHAVVVNETKMF